MKRGDGLASRLVTHLRLAHAEQSLLIAEVDLDVPAPEVGLHHRLDRQVGIGGDQECGIAIAHPGSFTRTIGQRRNHHHAQPPLRPGGLPEHPVQNLDAAIMIGAGGVNAHLLPGHLIVLAPLLRRGSRRTPQALAPTSGLRGGRIEQFGILANAANESDLRRQAGQKGLGGEARIGKKPDGAPGKLRAHVLPLLKGAGGEIQLLALFAVCGFLSGGSLPGQLSGGGRMQIIDGDAAHRGAAR